MGQKTIVRFCQIFMFALPLVVSHSLAVAQNNSAGANGNGNGSRQRPSLTDHIGGMLSPGNGGAVSEDEARIKLSNGQEQIYIKKSDRKSKQGNLQFDVGVVKDGNRYLLVTDELNFATSFSNGPDSSYMNKWGWETLKVVGPNGIAEGRMWFLFSAPGGRRYFVRRTSDLKLPYMLFVFFGDDGPVIRASSQVVLTPTNDSYYLFSFQDKTGRAASYIVDTVNSKTMKFSDKFIEFGEGKSKNFVLTGSSTREVVFNDPSSGIHDLTINLDHIESNAPPLFMPMMRTSADPAAEQTQATVIEQFRDKVKSAMDSGIGLFAHKLGEVTGNSTNSRPEDDKTLQLLAELGGHIDTGRGADKGAARGATSAQASPSREAPAKAAQPSAIAEGTTDRLTLSYNEQNYLLYSVADKSNPGTYLKRESDGKTVKVAVKVVGLLPPQVGGPDSPHRVTIDNGILSHPSLLRKIDLDAFDVEAKYTPTAEPKLAIKEETMNAQGQVTKSVIKKEGILEFINTFQDVRDDGTRFVKTVARREGDVNNVLTTLLRQSRASTILTGDAGDSAMIVREALLKLPRTWKLIKFEPGVIASGVSMAGVLGENVDKMVNYSSVVPTIWFAEDFENFVGIGAAQGSPSGLTDLLKKPIKDGIVRIAGTGGGLFYDRVSDVLLQQSLNPKAIDALSQADVLEAVHHWLQANPEYPKPSEEYLKMAIKVAYQFDVANHEPVRTINLLESIFAELDSQNKLKPENLTIELLKKMAAGIYRQDMSLLNAKIQHLRVKELPAKLDANLIGWEHAKKEVIEQATIRKLHDQKGPAVSFYFDGPPGVGKTEFVTQYAEAMGLPLKVIEMAQFKDPTSGDDLLAMIATEMKKNPYTVILLDEAEKANPKVYEALLTAMSQESFSTYIKVGEGPKQAVRSSLRNATVGMTTNILGEEILEWHRSLTTEQRELPHDELNRLFVNHFGPEYIEEAAVKFGIHRAVMDRFAFAAVGFPASKKSILKILEVNAHKVRKIVNSNYNIEASFPGLDKFVEAMANHSLENKLSTRKMIRALRRIMNMAASQLPDQHDELLEDQPVTGKTYEIHLKAPTCEAVLDAAEGEAAAGHGHH